MRQRARPKIDEELMKKNPGLASLRDAAEEVGVSYGTVVRWVQSAQLDGIRVGTGKGRVYVNVQEAVDLASPRPAVEKKKVRR